jgi:hypothetical protein
MFIFRIRPWYILNLYHVRIFDFGNIDECLGNNYSRINFTEANNEHNIGFGN